MITISESEPAPSDFELRIADAKTALAAMPPPSPSTSRQVVVAMREDIKNKAREYGQGGLEKVYRVFVDLGHTIAFSTFRDYIYNGEASREAKGAKVARKPPRIRKAARADEMPPVPDMPMDIVTESTANGGPVRARKMT